MMKNLNKPICYKILLLMLLFVQTGCRTDGQVSKTPDTPNAGSFRQKNPPEYLLASLPKAGKLALQTPHFQFLAHGVKDTSAISEYARHCETAIMRVQQFAGKPEDDSPTPVHLYRTAEEKGLLLRNTDRAEVDFEKNELHVVLSAAYRSSIFSGEENRLPLRQVLGEPKMAALERGLAIYFTKNWQQKGYEHWAAALVAAGASLRPDELLDEEFCEKISPLITGCQSAVFVDFLMKKWGKAAFLEKYAGWEPLPEELAALEPEWSQHLQKVAALAAKNPNPVVSRSVSANPKSEIPIAIGTNPQSETSNPKFLKGFNFAHEGYGIFDGYGSRMADSSLSKMQTMGVNAVSIVPYTFMRNPKSPAPLPVLGRPGTENDESVVQSAFDARQRGMTVMMKPQIWVGHNYWTGDIEFEKEEDWRSFFRLYSLWILHYALLGELHDWEMLCIGTELVQTTRRDADWRALIANVRKIYGGQLTYAANWGEEFEKLAFWDALDFIGLNCYYPLSKKDDPSDRELRKGFAAVLSISKKVRERFGKPLIFTEIGFASQPATWKEPHKDDRSGYYDGEAQRRCYSVVAEALKSWDGCAGIFWWKFPTRLDYRGFENTDFTPNNKPAEEVVRGWFRE